MAAHHWPARKQERCQNGEASTSTQAPLKLLSSLKVCTAVLRSLLGAQGPGLGLCEMLFVIRVKAALLWHIYTAKSLQ